MKKTLAINKVQVKSIIYLLYFLKKHIAKSKTVLYIFSLLVFTILLSSCKTCKCPAYSQNYNYSEEQNSLVIDISVEDNLFATKNAGLNNGLTN